MIRNAEMGKEIIVSAANKAGILANISKILADHGLNIEGVAGYAAGNDAKIMLVCDDELRASDALKKAGYKMDVKDVVVVDLENKMGALKVATAKILAEKLDIRYTYGTTCTGGCAARIVFSTSDNEKALVALKTK